MNNSWGSVRILRDAYGTPLIDASTEPAAYFGLGHAQAEDDLHGVLRQYLLVRGELGEPDRDANQRRWQVLEEARRGFDGLPDDLRACYEAFVAGIGAWMDEHPEQVPAWAPPLEPALPIGVNRTVMLFWIITDGVEALRAAGVVKADATSEKEVGFAPLGSNAWVIRPWRTATGETILVSDPHLPFGGAFGMYEAVVRAGDLHYSGFGFLGAMLPPLAHNRTCAWGLTTGGPRVADAYRIAVDGDVYLYDGEPRKVLRHDGQEYVVHNGVVAPVLARDDEAVYVVCTPYMGLAGETERQFMAMVRARDVAGLRAAFEACAFPPQNVLAADASGDCFYLRTGRVPVRASSEGGVLDGNTSATAWLGVRPASDLVQISNPASGYLQNCNTAPDTVTPDPALASERWHPDVFNDEPGRTTSRGRRSGELLPRAFSVDVPEVTAWAVDDLWPDTAVWQARLLAAASGEPGRVRGWPGGHRRLLHRLLAFDGHASPESTDATAWVSWRTRISGDDLLDAVERAAQAVPDGVYRTYGEEHRLLPGVPGRGGALELDVSLRSTYYAQGMAFAGGPCLRIVALGGHGMRSWSVSMPGQAELYSRGEVKPIVFDPS
ncbi:penicillin acylase family protein [Streptosporangium carneum]|uniref:7-beta-(4-carbaxybutanamido)cephalosporanic acid acylase n=1 Tax=Streptosporangium carneum TaxID=47481 RepID=A0A9W6MFQ4_9ACTN|nr:penicillin acylase family protein [Streptosporangium carneum]GLK12310.1 7-beta-(4-carbaxybutanamido)cephalosporanic acid acylase [Streptosporangium carneum]